MAKKQISLETPKKIKIVGINGSPRKDANTAEMVKFTLKAAESVGYVETEYYDLPDYYFSICIDCKKCYAFNRPADVVGDSICYNDPANKAAWLHAKCGAADATVVGFPVYGGHQAALFRMFMEVHGAGTAADHRREDSFNYVMGAGNQDIEDYKPMAIISQGGRQYSSEEIAYQATVHRSGGFISGAWPTVEDPEPQASFQGGMLICTDGIAIYAKDAWKSTGSRIWPPLTGIQNERTLRNLGRWLAVSAMMMKLGRSAFRKADFQTPQLQYHIRYSVKPAPGSEMDRDVKEGRVTHLTVEELKERMKTKA